MMTEEVIEVKIFMNNGQRKYGVLLDANEILKSSVDTIKFVCNSKINHYNNSAASHLVEMLPWNEVKAVETYLR
ncbi:MAG: hypothetical protein ACK46S_00970 [Bacteroidota bacterium]|jgi:hypothetical protein